MTMGDSDEEHDRRRRDKFRGERNDYDNNRRPPPNRYDNRGRGDRMSGGGGGWERGAKRDYYATKDQNRGGDRRESSYGRGSSPPAKRKKEWESSGSHWQGSQQDSNALVPQDKSSAVGAPILMSFKDFVIKQEDDVDEVAAVKRYQEYKVEFRRTQINDFFVLHKDEEWFTEKYHPTKSVDRQTVVRKAMRRRLRTFLDLWEEGYIDKLQVNLDSSSTVLKFLDQVVTRLEGGSEEDFKALDLPPSPVKEKPKEEEEEKKEKPEKEEEEKEPLPPGMEDEDEPLPPGMEEDDTKKEEETESTVCSRGRITEKKEETEEKAEDKQVEPFVYDGSRMKHPLSVFMRSIPATITRADMTGVCKRYPGFLRVAFSEPAVERRYSRRCWATFEHDVNIKDINWSMSNIRIKDIELSPCVNREVNNRIRTVNGVACSPMSMQLDVNLVLKLIKKLDEKSRVYEKEEANGVTEAAEKKPAEEPEEPAAGEEDDDDQADKKSDDAVKTESDEKVEPEPVIEVPETNPLLESIPDDLEFIVTDFDLENNESDSKETPLVVDDKLMKYLDLGILYLRVVHCLDYYNANEYIHEDEMPTRCGIIHVRSQPLESASKKDVYEFYNGISTKLEHLLKDGNQLSEAETEKLGKKVEETEVENFIKANTQEIAKDKWLCPLSGKKFRGPEFVRKHIMMKHLADVDEVKTEVKFFNNYVSDPKRPMFPDPKRSSSAATPSSTYHGHGNMPTQGWSSNRSQTYTPRSAYQTPYNPSTPQSAPLPDTYGRVNTFPPKGIKRSGGGSAYKDNRRVIKYRDLDAPEESDFF